MDREHASALFAGMDLTFILDRFRALEKLRDAPEAMIPDDAEHGATHGRLKQLAEDGKVSQAPVELGPEAERREKNAREFVGNCLSNPHRMHYRENGRRCLPVCSGIIDGSCKHVVVDRLKKSGSLWSVAGVDGAAAIRFFKLSDRIADFFQWRAAA